MCVCVCMKWSRYRERREANSCQPLYRMEIYVFLLCIWNICFYFSSDWVINDLVFKIYFIDTYPIVFLNFFIIEKFRWFSGFSNFIIVSSANNANWSAISLRIIPSFISSVLTWVYISRIISNNIFDYLWFCFICDFNYNEYRI